MRDVEKQCPPLEDSSKKKERDTNGGVRGDRGEGTWIHRDRAVKYPKNGPLGLWLVPDFL